MDQAPLGRHRASRPQLRTNLLFLDNALILRARIQHRKSHVASKQWAPRIYWGPASNIRPPLSNIDSYAANDDGFFQPAA
ncbi:hypothetical protein EV129_1242 [Rhizobium azibense]|uniref:Uncharacterized protein n=1 Tax=Rhizobium azibense TaxID=1136135 RepID=A0A4R3RCF5_9HYPH|nr:hypothetical protein EV129_1242 [Rhizobium azibense]